MKKVGQILAAALLVYAAKAGIAVALDAPPGDPKVVELLSGLSYVPDRSSLDAELSVDDLVQIAEDTSVNADPGLRLRALRALGEYDGNPQKTTAAAALRSAIGTFQSASVGTELLYLRSSMHSLARIDGGNAVPDLVDLLSHPSRDIRAACSQALGITGSTDAIQPLRDQALIETEPQVELAIADALFQLGS